MVLDKASRKYVKETMHAFGEMLDTRFDSPPSPGGEVQWNRILLRYSCLAIQLYSSVIEERGSGPMDYFPEWSEATDQLLATLDSREEIWARILRCRIAMNYVAFLYNATVDNPPMFSASALKAMGVDLKQVVERYEFIDRADEYVTHVDTALHPIANQIAIYSHVYADKSDCDRYKKYRVLWERFSGRIKELLSDKRIKKIHKNQRKIVHEPIEMGIEFMEHDKDLAHFRSWFRETYDLGPKQWYEKNRPVD